MTSTQLPRSVWLTITAVKLAVVVTIGVLGSVGGSTTASAWPEPSYSGPVVDQASARTHRMLDAHSCSTTGFDTSQQPLSAVIKSASGKLRFVDFDTGWRVYTAHGAAELVAVCLDDPPLR